MSDDKLSEEGLRKEIKNLLSWGHAHDYDDIIREAREYAWDEVATWFESERNSPGLADDVEAANPYRKQEEA